MTIIDVRPETSPAPIETTEPTPIYRVNPWYPRATFSGAIAGGATLNALVTALTHPGQVPWLAAGTALGFWLLFAFCLAGFELRERFPIYTDRI